MRIPAALRLNFDVDSAKPFLVDRTDRRVFKLAQKALFAQQRTASLSICDLGVDEGHLVHIAPSSVSKAGRGLWTSRPAGERKILAYFIGRIQNLREFEAENPLKFKNKKMQMPFSWLKNSDPGDPLRFEIVENPETLSLDISGLEVTMTKSELQAVQGHVQDDKYARVTFLGFRESPHTLKISENLFIDLRLPYSEKQRGQTAKKPDFYLGGLATFANSDDPPFGDGTKSNCEIWVCRKPLGAFLVSQKPLHAGEELFTSYVPSHIFATAQQLQKALSSKSVMN